FRDDPPLRDRRHAPRRCPPGLPSAMPRTDRQPEGPERGASTSSRLDGEVSPRVPSTTSSLATSRLRSRNSSAAMAWPSVAVSSTGSGLFGLIELAHAAAATPELTAKLLPLRGAHVAPPPEALTKALAFLRCHPMPALTPGTVVSPSVSMSPEPT